MPQRTVNRIRRLGIVPTVGALTAGMLTPLLITSVAAAASPHARHPITRLIKAGAPLKYHATHTGGKAYAPGKEIRDTGGGADPDTSRHSGAAVGVPRSPRKFTGAPAAPAAPTSDGITRTAPKLLRSFQGLDHYDSRFANNGNQFSGEPPDQGLCVGKGAVVETVNNVIRVYNRRATRPRGAEDLNTFLGYKPAIDRTTGKFGPNVFDVSCLFDPASKQFFFVADTLMVDRTPATSPARPCSTSRCRATPPVSGSTTGSTSPTTDPTGRRSGRAAPASATTRTSGSTRTVST